MLDEITRDLDASRRLTSEQAVWLYESAPSDWLRQRADAERRRRHGEAAFYNRNIHFEPTNKCVYACKFCAFARKPGATEAEGAWDYGFDELARRLDAYPVGALTEIHITGGVHPERGVDFGEALVGFIRQRRPELHIKAFTAVEITWMAKVSGLSVEDALRRLQSAGLGSLPGGGAEIFDDTVRRKIAGGKAPANRWLEVHGTGHRIGLRSNATMLYGHIESFAHRVDHMKQLRDLQDKTRGFMAFIPLRFRNENNRMSEMPEVDLEQDLRNYAVARLFLDNIPHLKAYWVMLGVDKAFQALEWGVDDLDGTVDDSTKIYSMAGSMQNPTLSSGFLRDEITKRGRLPVERDSLYQPFAGATS